ncbi:hypothetical protein [Candidatus Enterovibrio escicola]|uniref:Uncharacterized protein n=1 Tax=Candidatus Enterovibrio escicola TaxID=1927127 RepID=A0A2A5T6D9_9GAMM|nr:hypothetical protein BTN49_0667 [Candidatus Enterovibrio escacola]
MWFLLAKKLFKSMASSLVDTYVIVAKHVAELSSLNIHTGLICEVDEQWSFVGNKNTPRWL